MFVYNLSLIVIFWVLQQFINLNFKVLFSFADLKLNPFLLTSITIALFSIAGVPPFLGFFTKVIILISLINSNFFIFFIFFFALLFFSLYFYLQNLRFLYSTGYSTLNYDYELNLRAPIITFTFLSLFSFLLVFGFAFMGDILLFFSWLFN